MYVGRFASRARLAELQRLRVTDIINVSDTPSQLTIDDGPFRSVSWLDIEDRILMPTKTVIDAIDTIHKGLCADDGCVYVHYMAGWNRSPTVIWLYFYWPAVSIVRSHLKQYAPMPTMLFQVMPFW